MTLAQALDYLRQRHNESSASTYWDSQELYSLMTARCNEILSVIGLIEALDTSITTVASTQSYSFPTNVEFVKKVLYDDYPVQQVSLREAESEKEGNTTATGRPEYWFEWAKKIYFVPIPSEAKTVTLYCEKLHPYIDNSAQTTIDIPDILHYRMLDGVLADMYAKDLNTTMFQSYESKWNKIHMPSFYQYKMIRKYRGQSPSVVDADSTITSEHGIV